MTMEETVIYDRLDAQSIILIERDDKEKLVSQLKQLLEQFFEGNENRDLKPHLLNRSILSEFFEFACKTDSVNCAKALLEGEAGIVPNLNEKNRNGRTALHIAAENSSKNCIQLLLENGARTDLQSNGDSVIPLEIALASSRIQSLWNPEETIEDLIIRLSKTDLSSVRSLVEKTNDVSKVAYVNAMEGKVASLAALLMVASEKVTIPKIYECVVWEALSLGQKGDSSSSSKGGGKQICGDSNYGGERRKLLLFEIQLLSLFVARTAVSIFPRHGKDQKTTSPLIRAAQESASSWLNRYFHNSDREVSEAPLDPRDQEAITFDQRLKGTTIVAIVCQDFIILAADGKSTHLDTKDIRIDEQKLEIVGKSMVCGMSGCYGHASKLISHLKDKITEKLVNQRIIRSVTIFKAASLAHEQAKKIIAKDDEEFKLTLAGFDWCEDGRNQKPCVAWVIKECFHRVGDELSDGLRKALGAAPEDGDKYYCTSGSMEAQIRCIEILRGGYKHDLTITNAVTLAEYAIAKTSEVDQNTGGQIKVCVISKDVGQEEKIKFMTKSITVTQVLAAAEKKEKREKVPKRKFQEEKARELEAEKKQKQM